MSSPFVLSLLNKQENAHDSQIYCCAWATIKDNQKKQDYIVTGGLDGLLKIWLLENNAFKLRHELAEHSMPIVSIAVSADGHTIATSSMDSNLIIWELLSGYRVHAIDTDNMEIFKVAFSPDGTRVVSGSHNGKLIVYDIVNNEIHCELDTRKSFPLCVAWSNNGKHIASGSVDGKVISLFSVIHGKLVHSIEAHTQLIRSVAFTHDSRLLISASYDGTVRLFDVESGNEQGCMKFGCWVTSVCASPDDTRMAVGCADGSVTIVMLENLKVLKAFNEHTDTVWDVKFNSEGNKLVSIAKDKSINIYECPIPPKSEKSNSKLQKKT